MVWNITSITESESLGLVKYVYVDPGPQHPPALILTVSGVGLAAGLSAPLTADHVCVLLLAGREMALH